MNMTPNKPIYRIFFYDFFQNFFLNSRSNSTFLCLLLISAVFPLSFNVGAQTKVYKRSEKYRTCTYTVKTGDTLFRLSRRYEISLKKLAFTNHISPPYKLLKGQKIHIPTDSTASCSGVLHKGEKRGSQESVVSVKYKEDNSEEKKRLLSRRTIHWTWPVKKLVKVTDELSSGGLVQQALVVQVKPNSKVDAAASGVVLYAGEDISGYGKLIIIEHNRYYLSIYGNNSKIFVSKGNAVKAGQEIAEIGSTGMQEPKLHFEIRRNGKPVDPLHYLPKR